MFCTIVIVLLVVSTSTTFSYIPQAAVPTSLCRLITIAARETSAIIVYDDKYENESVLDLVVSNTHPVLVYTFSSFRSFLGPHIKNVLENAALGDYRSRLNFILVCGKHCIEDIMSQVFHLDNTIGQRSLLRHFSTWWIISLDSPPQLNTMLDNVAYIRVSQGTAPTDAMYPSGIKQHLNRSTEKTKAPCDCLVNEVYTLLWMPGGRQWSHVKSHDLSHDHPYKTVFPNTFRGLNGRKLVLVTLEWRPYAKRQVTAGRVDYVGAGVGVMDMLGRMFNFSYVIVEPPDMLWGQELENGSWSGVSGMVKRAEADTSPVPYGVSMGRKAVLDFTHPVTASVYSVVYRRRPNRTKSWLYFLSCFTWQVYLCGSVSVLWTVVILVFIHKMNEKCSGHVDSKWTGVWSVYFDTAFRIVVHQDITLEVNASSVRFLVITWSLFCLVMVAVYTGNLVAFATVEKYKPPFTTLQELVEQNDYTIGVLEGGYAENVLMTSQDPLLKAMYSKIKQSFNPANAGPTEDIVPDNIQQVLDEKYVFIAAGPVMDIIRSRTCDVVEMKQLFPIHSSFIFPRYSPLRKLFDEQVLAIRERGVMSKLEQQWTPKLKSCDSSMNVPIFELDSLKTALLACSAGLVMATIVLLLEMRKKR